MKIDREAIKDRFPFLAHIVYWSKRRKNELSAIRRHFSRRRLQKRRIQTAPGRIKVVFICQYIPAWSKNKALYDALAKDGRFKPMLLCVPNRIHANQLDDPEDMSNDVYDYFHRHGYMDAINSLVGKNEWFDLNTICPDYVIYNRYDRPMPLEYTSRVVSTYAKVCMIEYGTSLLRMVDQIFDRKFMANTFCYFAESTGKRDMFLNWNRILHGLKLSTAVCCGIPAVENAYLAKDDNAPAWRFSKNKFRAIYTPRWTVDPVWGGSSFLRYQSFFLELADLHPEMDILVRPHPLMFQNFIETGLMTSDEVTAYGDSCSARANIRLDAEKEYLASFWQSSVLISDFSSMIIEYYVTGKPIIYLTYDENTDYTDQMSAMLQGCYLVHNEQDLKKTVEMLLAGEDPLGPIRAEVCETELLQGANLKASENMKQVLLESYRK